MTERIACKWCGEQTNGIHLDGTPVCVDHDECRERVAKLLDEARADATDLGFRLNRAAEERDAAHAALRLCVDVMKDANTTSVLYESQAYIDWCRDRDAALAAARKVLGEA